MVLRVLAILFFIYPIFQSAAEDGEYYGAIKRPAPYEQKEERPSEEPLRDGQSDLAPSNQESAKDPAFLANVKGKSNKPKAEPGGTTTGKYKIPPGFKLLEEDPNKSARPEDKNKGDPRDANKEENSKKELPTAEERTKRANKTSQKQRGEIEAAVINGRLSVDDAQELELKQQKVQELQGNSMEDGNLSGKELRRIERLQREISEKYRKSLISPDQDYDASN